MPKYMTGKKNEMHVQLVCNLVFIKIPEMWLKKKKRYLWMYISGDT